MTLRKRSYVNEDVQPFDADRAGRLFIDKLTRVGRVKAIMRGDRKYKSIDNIFNVTASRLYASLVFIEDDKVSVIIDPENKDRLRKDWGVVSTDNAINIIKDHIRKY